MLDGVEHLPLVDDRVVILEIEVGLAIFHPIIAHHVQKFVDEHRADSLVGVFGNNADEAEVDRLGLLHRFEDA